MNPEKVEHGKSWCDMEKCGHVCIPHKDGSITEEVVTKMNIKHKLLTCTAVKIELMLFIEIIKQRRHFTL